MSRTPDEAVAALLKLWDATSPDVEQMADLVTDMLNNPALPMLLRVAGCGRVMSGAMGRSALPEWLALRAAVQERAGDKCECCGVDNGAIGVRLLDGSFLDLGIAWRPGDIWAVDTIALPLGDRQSWVSGGVGQMSCMVFRIVCTVAHFDGKLVDHSLGNLRFWCQQCHNRHDAPARAASRKARQ